MVIVQIYSMKSLDDAISVADAGADHIGFMVSSVGVPFAVDTGLGREVSRAVRPKAKTVIIPISHSPREILELARLCEPDMVQLANDAGMIGEQGFASLSKELRQLGFRTIKVVAVGGGGELEEVRKYSGYADMLMLDSYGPPPSDELKGYIGGTGKVHDWSLSARIVKESPRPVILAGGLSPQNVTAALDKVRPWGVDAATSLDIRGSGGRKDMAKVRTFIKLVKGFEG